MMEGIWCMRFYYSDLFYIALTYIAVVRLDPVRRDRDALLSQAAANIEKIRACTAVDSSNYQAWILLAEAEMADVTDKYDLATRNYESALDHCELHGFTLDQATTYELYGEFLIRRSASRPACRLLTESIAAYRRVTASGKVEHISEKHALILSGTFAVSTAEAGTQTTALVAEEPTYKLGQSANRDVGLQSSAERTQAWLVPTESENKQAEPQGELPGGFSAAGLDMIDLTSILESSQVLSSELQVDKLLAKMTEIIVESTGADLGAIIIEDEDVG